MRLFLPPLLAATALTLSACSSGPTYRAVRRDAQPLQVVRAMCRGEANAAVDVADRSRPGMERYGAVERGCMARNGYMRPS